jgi:hypothetical protein
MCYYAMESSSEEDAVAKTMGLKLMTRRHMSCPKRTRQPLATKRATGAPRYSSAPEDNVVFSNKTRSLVECVTSRVAPEKEKRERFIAALCFQYALTIPPSMSTVWPVMYVLAGEPRNTAIFAYSSGVP